MSIHLWVCLPLILSSKCLGIILCPSSICVVREFCSKGSLIDILRNKDLKLDALFITSFVEDLIKGMIYLHESDVRGKQIFEFIIILF